MTHEASNGTEPNFAETNIYSYTLLVKVVRMIVSINKMVSHTQTELRLDVSVSMQV